VNRDPPRPRLYRIGPELPGSSGSRVFGRASLGARRETLRVDEHEPQGSVRVRSEERRRKALDIGRSAGRRRSTSARVGMVSECRSRSDASRSLRLPAPTRHAAETSDLARRKRSRRRDVAKATDLEQQRCVGGVLLFSKGRSVSALATCASLVGIASGGVRARRLGKSQGREHVATDTMKGCLGRGRASLNRGYGRGPGSEGERSFVPYGAAEPAGGAETEPRTPVLFGRQRHSEVGTILVAPPVVLSLARHGAGGRHPRRRAPQCGASVVDVRLAAFAPRVTQGSREPGGVRHAECAGIEPIEAGDG
jgi:hypothetical protein